MYATAEHQRLAAANSNKRDWKMWGPYVSERAWGTVREDYSADGDAWNFFTHDQARSRAYRWNEDGLAGISDDKQYLCFGLALWNGYDPILKERMFGLSGPEGNHGEDVKEYYFYLDSTPTHSYMKMLYKYPQREFPYEDLVTENRRRDFHDYEYELMDTGILSDERYFDVFVTYAKADTEDILIQIEIVNRAPEAADCHVLPTLWFRNTWSWGFENGPMKDIEHKPQMTQSEHSNGASVVQAKHPALNDYFLYAENAPDFIFTENETNLKRLFNSPNHTPYVKDAFHRCVINGEAEAVNPAQEGTKTAALYHHTLQSGETYVVRLRLSTHSHVRPFDDFASVLDMRQREADEFYASMQNPHLNADERSIQRQALAGLLWSKQLFYYDVEQWISGDPDSPAPQSRLNGRNHEWRHLNNFDVISMPDKWEYPWYAGWDLAFHCIPLAMVDAEFAKQQIILLTREWYMHPNGQLPAYEWMFGDVNPPVHAWAAMKVYEMDAHQQGKPDTAFLKRIFNKILLNFTWWVNRKDAEGRNIFQGGFLGLDNISLFDRSAPLPTGGYINQSDCTAWMGFYCLTMLDIAIELAKDDPSYEDMAVKFFEHFLAIAVAISGVNHNGTGLWDEEDGFFYDVLRLPDGSIFPLKVRSLVGLMPMMAVETIGQSTLTKLTDFARSMKWMLEHRPHLTGNIAAIEIEGYGNAVLCAIPTRERLIQVLRYMLDENEFLSEYGIRSISKVHEKPYSVTFGGQTFSINYQPAESQSGLFGGNSNWRGPIWFPINYLLIEALRRYYRYYGDELKVECPTGSGIMLNLKEVADELSRRLARIFLRNANNQRPLYGGQQTFQNNPQWRDYILFHEYFQGNNGAGLGASHQTGWTGLIADLIQRTGGTT